METVKPQLNSIILIYATVFPTKLKKKKFGDDGGSGKNRHNNKRKAKYEIIIIAIKMFGFSSDIKKRIFFSNQLKTQRTEREREWESRRAAYTIHNDFEHNLLVYNIHTLNRQRGGQWTIIIMHMKQTFRRFVCAPFVFILCSALHLLYQITGYHGRDDDDDANNGNADRKTNDALTVWCF